MWFKHFPRYMLDNTGGTYDEELPKGMASLMDRIFHTMIVPNTVVKAFLWNMNTIGGTNSEKFIAISWTASSTWSFTRPAMAEM